MTRHPSFLLSTILSRSWWIPWWKCGRSSTTCCLTSSRSSKCPRFFLTRSRSAPLSRSRRRQNSWWQCLGSSSSSSGAPKAHFALESFALVGTLRLCVCVTLVGSHRQPRAVYEYWATLSGRPCDHALQVPAVLADLQWMVPQILFIDRMLALQLLHRDRAHSANCSDDLSFHGAVLGRCRHARWCANDRAMVLTVQNS